MRARHRHFNARDIGAEIVLDARFISGLSDGDTVALWSDRSRNSRDATQSTEANKPTYETAETGGNPVVRVGANKVLEHAAFTQLPSKYVCVFKKSANGNSVIMIYGANSYAFLSYNTVWYGAFGLSGVIDIGTQLTDWSVISAELTSTTNQVWVNGTSSGTSDSSIGRGEYKYIGFDGNFIPFDVGAVFVLPGNVPDTLKKRLEHAAAYSFKIPCS
jgi:hypothetical protein